MHAYPGSETAYTVGDLRRLAAHCATAPSTAAGERDTEALAEFLNSECEFADGLTGTSWPQHSHDDGYRGGGGYVRLAPPDVVARRREDAKAILSFLSQRRTAAPTAPSTAAGEREAIERDAARYRHLRAVAIRNDGGPSWPGPGVPAIAVPQDHHSGYFVNEEDADMHVDAAMEAAATAAALATPPAQVSDMRQDYAYQAPDSGSVSAPADVPWQEQAARQCEEWADKLVERASAAPSTFERIQFNADAVKLRDHARAFRALSPSPVVPWEEQAAQIRRDALEEAARICRDEAMLCRRDMRLASALSAETCAYLIRALLSKPAKGEGE